MGEVTGIEWCDSTFNPWVGCQKVSPGCDNCYAEHLMDHRFHRVSWGPHGQRQRTSPQTWREPLKWKPIDGRRRRVFCASLSDWLDNRVPQQWRIDLAALIEATPGFDWLLLSKRIENYHRLAPWKRAPDNVWIGVTMEDQKRYDARWERLRHIDAPVRFVSYEPAIGPLRIRDGIGTPDWIICGGETGARSRQMDTKWARDLRDECARMDVPFYFKQMTDKARIPDDLLVRQFPMGVIRWPLISPT